MKRRRFLGVSAAALAVAAPFARSARAGEPPQLRVLLGDGDAQPVPGGGFTFDGRRYRGHFFRIRQGVVNALSLDEYLYSVVPSEMPSSWPDAALEAQAICSRTYVARRMDPTKAYDVTATSVQRSYAGVASESSQGAAAVDATSGTVLAWRGALVQSVYSSCCGGRTESAADAWGGPPVDYLGGVECPYCTQAPYYRWSSSVTLDEVAVALTHLLAGAGRVNDVRLGTLDAAGRAREFLIDASLRSVTVRGADFRSDIGTERLLSLRLYRFQTQGAVISADGGGKGHGVGLCQWGARGIALAGATANDVLAFYYPGTTIVSWTSVWSPPTITPSPRG